VCDPQLSLSSRLDSFSKPLFSSVSEGSSASGTKSTLCICGSYSPKAPWHGRFSRLAILRGDVGGRKEEGVTFVVLGIRLKEAGRGLIALGRVIDVFYSLGDSWVAMRIEN